MTLHLLSFDGQPALIILPSPTTFHHTLLLLMVPRPEKQPITLQKTTSWEATNQSLLEGGQKKAAFFLSLAETFCDS